MEHSCKHQFHIINSDADCFGRLKLSMLLSYCQEVAGKHCIELGTDLENLPLSEYQAVCDVFTEDVYTAISLENCVSQRTAFGGPAPQLVKAQAQRVKEIAENIS